MEITECVLALRGVAKPDANCERVQIFLTLVCYTKYENEIWNAFRNVAFILLISPCFVLFLSFYLKEPKSVFCVPNYGHIY